MRLTRFRTATAVAVVSMAAGLAVPAAAQTNAVPADELTLRRVMLSTGGVGYFEYEATVVGDAELNLEVRLDQVDDVLKSIVVYDDVGGIGEISLPGQEPLREVFREMPFGPDALSSPVTLLNALRGAEIRVGGTREVVGRVIAVVPEQTVLPDGAVIARHRVSVLADEGIRQLILEEADSLAFVDDALQAQIAGALVALSQHNERDRRELTVTLSGEGERSIRVAYVVEVPLWKTAYRLTLSDDIANGTADLQGWAVIENLSGDDWDEVDLTVVSGNPVTFTQALYQAYYVDRPEVPVEVLGRVLPGIDAGAAPIPRDQMAEAEGFARFIPELPESSLALDTQGVVTGAATGGFAPAPPAPAQVLAAESTEAATQVMFRFPEPVTVASGHSLLVPVVSREIPVDRISLYQRATHPQHPLATVDLSNDGESGLPPGILTLYERSSDTGVVSFVGDARLGAFPAGEDRLVSFAVDERVRVDHAEEVSQAITQGRIVDGLLRLTTIDRRTETYTIIGAAREDRVVVVEAPRYDGWDLVEPSPDTVERTDTGYRIRQPAAAGETLTVQVVQERPRSDVFQLVSLQPHQISYYASATELPSAVRDAMVRIGELQRVVADRERLVGDLERQVGTIVNEQGRIRHNLDSVPRDSDLYQRYLAMLSEQEDTLIMLRDEIEDARDSVEEARADLRGYISDLNT